MIPELQRFESCLSQHLQIDDWIALRVIVASAVAHKLTDYKVMLWLRIIGASGSGKTEILRSIMALEGYVESLETLTPAAIRRGMQIYKRNKETDVLEKVQLEPTLLERLDGKLVITKELAPLLTKHHDSKLEIFGLLRSVHDGELDADYGSMQGHVKQQCNFDWILATTTFVDSQNQLDLQLGSRFTDIRWGSPLSRKQASWQAANNVPLLPTIRQELASTMQAIISHADVRAIKGYKPHDDNWFLELCDILAVLRTPVDRDGYTREIKQKPSPELPTRICQNCSKVALGLKMLGIEDIKPYITRLVWDGLPPNRSSVMKSILALENDAKKKGIVDYQPTQSAIENVNGSGLSQQSISLILKEMKVLGAKDVPWREYLG